MARPDACPNCGAPCSSHTGTYCEECGEPLTKEAQRELDAAEGRWEQRYLGRERGL